MKGGTLRFALPENENNFLISMASSRLPVQPSQETDEQQKLRFQVELEFVQCLANPNYLNFLAQRNYFKDQSFVNYLKYLQYWKEAKYAKYLKYPQCLHFLELLQYEHFRKELVNLQCAKFIEDQQILHWQHYQRKRMALLQAQADLATTQQQQQQQQGGSGGTGTLTGIGSQLGAGTGGPGCSVSSQPPQTGTIPTSTQPSLNSQSSSLQQAQQVIKEI